MCRRMNHRPSREFMLTVGINLDNPLMKRVGERTPLGLVAGLQ
jgi:hypothetical protein